MLHECCHGPSRMLLHRREKWTCSSTLPSSAASYPNTDDDVTTTRMVTIYTKLKPWVNAEARAGSKADTPYGTCSLPEPLPFGFCAQLEELCQLKKTVSHSASTSVNITLQGSSFGLIIQDAVTTTSTYMFIGIELSLLSFTKDLKEYLPISFLQLSPSYS